MFLLCCPHSQRSGAESQSAALGWGNSQLILQLEKGAVTASAVAFPEGFESTAPGTTGYGHKWHMGKVPQGAVLSSPWHQQLSSLEIFLQVPSLSAHLCGFCHSSHKADLAKIVPIAPPPSTTPLQQQFKQVPSRDVFFTVFTQALNHLNTPPQLQTHRSSTARLIPVRSIDTQSLITGINSWKSHSWKQMFKTGLDLAPTLPFKVSFHMLSMVKTPNWRFQFYWKPPSFHPKLEKFSVPTIKLPSQENVCRSKKKIKKSLFQ